MQKQLFNEADDSVSRFDRHHQPLTRSAAQQQLAAFLPRAGRAYTRDRNYDLGPKHRGNVSGLSPYLRHRLVTEQEVVTAVLAQHSPSAAEKFVQEVFWRTYFKGWLEHRPVVWTRYREQLGHQLALLNEDATALAQYRAAVEGQTGIEAFDSWAQELVVTNYLHNHARMWFASIWIFTLKLPWELGADFFLTHLLDGDPASNTLSWRWVGGLHTKGKNYLARADNIARYTGGRFPAPTNLNELADPLEEDADLSEGHSALQMTPISDADLLAATDEPVRWLLHEEDLHPEDIETFAADLAANRVTSLTLLNPVGGHGAYGEAEAVSKARQSALDDLDQRLTTLTSTPVTRIDASQLANWAGEGTTAVRTPFAPVGPARDALLAAGVKSGVLRRYDEAAWPYCKKGFFKLKQSIPKLLEAF